MTDFIKAQKILIGAFVVPINKKGELFLTLRHEPSNPDAHNKWQFAGGGVEFGETPEQTAIREAQEEIGVTPKILYPHPVVQSNTWYNSDETNDYHVILINFIVDIGEQKIVLEEEASEWKWCSVEEIQTMSVLPRIEKTAVEVQKLIHKEKLLSLL